MSKFKTQLENPKGLHARYHIQKIVPVPQDFMGLPVDDKLELQPCDEDAEYFILRLDEGGKDKLHIQACRKAVIAYAVAIEPHLPELAKDLINKYG